MCGRYASSASRDVLVDTFELDEVVDLPGPSWNVAPTDLVPAVVERPAENGPRRKLVPLKWGLVPSWSKDASGGARMINARVETAAETPAYRSSFKSKRCLVVTDGFYEWKAPPPGEKRKQPFFIHRPDGEPYAFAGLWEQWKGPGPDGDEVTVRSATIITGAANQAMSAIHDRMPVILPPSEWETWLSPEQHDTELLGKLLVPAPDRLITMHPVSTDVNNVRNKGEHLIDEVDPLADEGRLL